MIESFDLAAINEPLSDVVHNHLRQKERCTFWSRFRQKLTVLESRSVTRGHHSTRDTGLVIVAPRQIEGVIVSLPALTEGPTVMDPDTVTPVQVFEAVPAAITVNVSTCALAFCYDIYMEHTKLRCSCPSLQDHNNVQVSDHLPGGVSRSLTASNTILYFRDDEVFTYHSVLVSIGILCRLSRCIQFYPGV